MVLITIIPCLRGDVEAVAISSHNDDSTEERIKKEKKQERRLLG